MGLVPVHLVAQAIDDIPPVVSQTLVPGARSGHQAEKQGKGANGARTHVSVTTD